MRRTSVISTNHYTLASQGFGRCDTVENILQFSIKHVRLGNIILKMRLPVVLSLFWNLGTILEMNFGIRLLATSISEFFNFVFYTKTRRRYCNVI